MCLRCEIYVHEYSYARVARLYKYSYTYIMQKKYLDALVGWCMRWNSLKKLLIKILVDS